MIGHHTVIGSYQVNAERGIKDLCKLSNSQELHMRNWCKDRARNELGNWQGVRQRSKERVRWTPLTLEQALWVTISCTKGDEDEYVNDGLVL
jgi:hypothetical protein